MQRGLLFKLDHAPIIIDACVILYDFILEHEGTWSSHVHIDDAQTRGGTGRGPGETSARREAEVAYLRDAGFLQEEWGDPRSRADRRRTERERPPLMICNKETRVLCINFGNEVFRTESECR